MQGRKAKGILVVGQTPPPHGGQAIMIEKMLDGDYGPIQLHHVRMKFSKDMDEVGRFSLSKLTELARLIARIYYARVTCRAEVLYYPPAGPDRVPILRDIAILLSTRWLFKKTIFHFHAGSLTEAYAGLPAPVRPLFRAAYAHPDVAVRISELAPEDGKRLGARKEYVIPNGIEDAYPTTPAAHKEEGVVDILFVGVLQESKGVMDLLRACEQLRRRGCSFRTHLMGRHKSASSKREILDFIQHHGLGEYIDFLGVCSGQEKWAAFARADILCFPSYFESETFGLVLVEAFSFGIPVVSTRWRGIPSIVEDGHTGFLVDIQDPDAVADCLERLILDPELRAEMGARGRQKYLQHYTIDRYRDRLRDVFTEVLTS